jgi:hypothetical protein
MKTAIRLYMSSPERKKQINHISHSVICGCVLFLNYVCGMLISALFAALPQSGLVTRPRYGQTLNISTFLALPLHYYVLG